MNELSDLTKLLDTEGYRPGYGKPPPPDEEEVTRCIQALLQRQCLYANQRRYSRVYEILSTESYQGFFRKYFSAMGLEFHWDHRSRMVALRVPRRDKRRFEYQAARLNKEETLVLMSLKLAYEEGFKNNDMGPRGEVEVTTDDLAEKIEVVAKVSIEEKSLHSALNLLKGKGVCDLGEYDRQERLLPITILPGVEVAWPEHYSEVLYRWAEDHRLAEEASDVSTDDAHDDTDDAEEGLDGIVGEEAHAETDEMSEPVLESEPVAEMQDGEN